MPETGRMLTEDNARRLRARPVRPGRAGRGDGRASASVLGSRDAMEAALAWYRASKGLAARHRPLSTCRRSISGATSTPRTGPDAAHGTAEFAAGAFAMEALPGVGHFDHGPEAPAKAVELLLRHLKKHPV